MTTETTALMGKRANWTIAHEVKGTVIQFAVKGAGELQLDTAKCHADILARAAIHGLVQRVSDAAAIPRDSKTGGSATPQEKFEAMKRLVEHYASGSAEWNRRVAQGERVRVEREQPGAELLRETLGLVYTARTAEQISEFVKGKKASEIAAMLAHESLQEAKAIAQAAIEERARAAGAGVDAAQLLSGL